MRNPIRFLVLLAMLGGCLGCGQPAKKGPKLDRELIGEQLEFGRKAAEYELWNEAIFRWNKVVEAEPDNADAANNLAVAYESVGDYEKARGFYEQALRLDEDSSAIRRNYKRFLNFYKRHQRQIKRDAERDSANPEDGGAQDDGDVEEHEDDQGGMP